jgi:hypothetical protein
LISGYYYNLDFERSYLEIRFSGYGILTAILYEIIHRRQVAHLVTIVFKITNLYELANAVKKFGRAPN